MPSTSLVNEWKTPTWKSELYISHSAFLIGTWSSSSTPPATFLGRMMNSSHYFRSQCNLQLTRRGGGRWQRARLAHGNHPAALDATHPDDPTQRQSPPPLPPQNFTKSTPYWKATCAFSLSKLLRLGTNRAHTKRIHNTQAGTLSVDVDKYLCMSVAHGNPS